MDLAVYEEALKTGILAGGILPKLQNAFNAIENGISKVKICKFDQIKFLNTPDFKGTTII